jgi:hypothetical protein
VTSLPQALLEHVNDDADMKVTDDPLGHAVTSEDFLACALGVERHFDGRTRRGCAKKAVTTGRRGEPRWLSVV